MKDSLLLHYFIMNGTFLALDKYTQLHIIQYSFAAYKLDVKITLLLFFFIYYCIFSAFRRTKKISKLKTTYEYIYLIYMIEYEI